MRILEFLYNLFHRDKEQIVNITFPTKWEMMTYQQFRDVCYILTLPGISKEKALFLCLCKLSGIIPANMTKYDPEKIKNKMAFIINGQEHLISADDVAAACRELSFIYDDIGLPPAPFPEIDRNINDLNFRQFYTADSFILRAGTDKAQAPVHLKEAAKVLTNGRKRKLTDVDRIALVIWWNGVKQLLKARYPYVFQSGESTSINKTQAEILQDLLSCMNDNRPQNNDLILKAPAHDVLYSLNKIYQDAHEKSNK